MLPVSSLPENFDDLLNRVKTTQQPIYLTDDGNVVAVIEDVIAYQGAQDELAMLRILAIGQAQVAEGRVTDHDAFFSELEEEHPETSEKLRQR